MVKVSNNKQISIRVLGRPGLRVNKDIVWPKGSEYRDCNSDELKVISKVSQSVFIFKDKKGNIINKEAQDVHDNSKPKRKRNN